MKTASVPKRCLQQNEQKLAPTLVVHLANPLMHRPGLQLVEQAVVLVMVHMAVAVNVLVWHVVQVMCAGSTVCVRACIQTYRNQLASTQDKFALQFRHVFDKQVVW